VNGVYCVNRGRRGFAPYGFPPYIFDTAFIEGAGLAFPGVVHAVYAGAIFRAPEYEAVIYAFAAPAFWHVHGYHLLFSGNKKSRQTAAA
jgi:hypothetical protein